MCNVAPFYTPEALREHFDFAHDESKTSSNSTASNDDESTVSTFNVMLLL